MLEKLYHCKNGSMKRLRTAAFRTSVRTCRHHSWSVARPEIGGTQRHKHSRQCKIQVQTWSDAVSELSACLCTQTQVWSTATGEHSSTKCHATRQVVCLWPPCVFRLSGAQPNLSWVHPPALVLSEMTLNPRRLHGSPARETAGCTEQ